MSDFCDIAEDTKEHNKREEEEEKKKGRMSNKFGDVACFFCGYMYAFSTAKANLWRKTEESAFTGHSDDTVAELLLKP